MYATVTLRVAIMRTHNYRGEVINGGFGLVLDGSEVSSFMMHKITYFYSSFQTLLCRMLPREQGIC